MCMSITFYISNLINKIRGLLWPECILRDCNNYNRELWAVILDSIYTRLFCFLSSFSRLGLFDNSIPLRLCAPFLCVHGNIFSLRDCCTAMKEDTSSLAPARSYPANCELQRCETREETFSDISHDRYSAISANDGRHVMAYIHIASSRIRNVNFITKTRSPVWLTYKLLR